VVRRNIHEFGQHMKVAAMVIILCGLLIACVSRQAHRSDASFANKVSTSGIIQLVGWAKLHGEFEIYADRESFDQELKFPNCISGVFSDQYEKDFSEYDGKRVTVTGELFVYSELPNEDRPVIPRKMLSGVVIPNWCYGRNVLLIKTIQLMP
jgi:hypothetical protein